MLTGSLHAPKCLRKLDFRIHVEQSYAKKKIDFRMWALKPSARENNNSQKKTSPGTLIQKSSPLDATADGSAHMGAERRWDPRGMGRGRSELSAMDPPSRWLPTMDPPSPWLPTIDASSPRSLATYPMLVQ